MRKERSRPGGLRVGSKETTVPWHDATPADRGAEPQITSFPKKWDANIEKRKKAKVTSKYLRAKHK